MINLGWNTMGRIGLSDYNKARWRHFAFCLIPVGLFIAGIPAVAVAHGYLTVAMSCLAAVLLFYYRYRFLQVMVRRLHDRNMSGKFLVLSPLLMVAALFVFVIFVGTAVVSDSTLPAWLDNNMQIVIWAIIIPFIGFNIFLRFQMSQAGTPGPNRYGPPPGMGQAQMF